jgi:hypothetical protein
MNSEVIEELSGLGIIGERKQLINHDIKNSERLLDTKNNNLIVHHPKKHRVL